MAGQILYPDQASLQEIERILCVFNQWDRTVRQKKYLRTSRDPVTNGVVVEVEDSREGLDRTFHGYLDWQLALKWLHEDRRRKQKGIVLEKLLSGPYSGAEFGVFMAACDAGIGCEGWYSKGRITRTTTLEAIVYDAGVCHITHEQLLENVAENVRQSCGTLIFGRKKGKTLAMKAAFELCAEQKKPVLTIIYPTNFPGRSFTDDSKKKYANPIVTWLQSNRIVTLNVTGSREESEDEEIDYFVREILIDVLQQLGYD